MPELPANLESAAFKLRHRLRPADYFVILCAIPVIVLLALVPASFELSWAGFGKLGLGGFFVALFFLMFEVYFYDFRKRARTKWSTNREVAVCGILGAVLSFFIAVSVSAGFLNFVYSLGPPGGSGGGSNSWLMAVDYLIFAFYIAGLAVALFNAKAIKDVITPILLCGAFVVFYLLDAFLPYGEIGPLQLWANFIVASVGFLARILGLPIYGFSNYLTIDGLKGFYRLAVFWPSVGVQSMIIYSVVMLVVAAKLDIPKIRKVIYASIGILGTIFLNVLRIFAIAFYGYAFATSGAQLDAFHNSLGELLFPVWIVLFLFLVLTIEDRIAPRQPVHARVPAPAGSRMKSRKLGAR